MPSNSSDEYNMRSLYGAKFQLADTFHPKQYLGYRNYKAYIAEAFATFWFLLITIGTVCSFYDATAQAYLITNPAASDFKPDSGMVLAVALAFGLSIAVLVSSISHISGGHINPAVTFALMVTGRINLVKGAIYIACQLAGAVIGVYMVDALWPDNITDAMAFGTNGLSGNLTKTQGVFLEFFGTAILTFTVFGTVVDPKGSYFIHHNAPLTIGFSVFLAHVMLIPMTGCGINPARSFAPAVLSGNWDDQWVYWVGPMLGGPFGAFMNYLPFNLFDETNNKENAKAQDEDAPDGTQGTQVTPKTHLPVNVDDRAKVKNSHAVDMSNQAVMTHSEDSVDRRGPGRPPVSTC
ncbi:hypothetical protein SARC_01224 [Sphaeroforma arctica JP610]|uniref:Aquaporin n=1 Tax=Sphaeroforma arctica JP610 TaxID=667725 RepID=A0A0L0GCL3_9EUKA|nr:hypothetical protein SARC_01224 [Sphaeroforma arctica JP610]KNC86644.1 hypothetical protein SARC_01224 [Sphaeroforma arctica JP610]|eukprot:XP_014160546.1 hypothetical protein SARC_01224 [Sphaeroforma arctica JP610]